VSVTLQRRFDFALGGGRPLHTVSGVMGLFDVTEDDVLYLIEDGQFAWAFDIATPGARKREIRIWRRCIMLRQGGDFTAEATIADVLEDILPKPHLPTIRAVSLCRAFNCSSSHIGHLISLGCLQEEASDRGITVTRILTRSSVERFLAERRVQ